MSRESRIPPLPDDIRVYFVKTEGEVGGDDQVREDNQVYEDNQVGIVFPNDPTRDSQQNLFVEHPDETRYTPYLNELKGWLFSTYPVLGHQRTQIENSQLVEDYSYHIFATLLHYYFLIYECKPDKSSSDDEGIVEDANTYLVSRASKILETLHLKLDFQQFVIDELAKRAIHWHPVFSSYPTQVMNIVNDFVKELQSNQALLEDLEKAGMTIDEFIASDEMKAMLNSQEVSLMKAHQKDGRQDYSNRLSKMSLEQLITFALEGGAVTNEHLMNL